MSYALGSRRCSVTGCSRAVLTTAHGRVVYGRCGVHTALALTHAFADSPSGAARLASPSVGVQLPAGSRVVVTAGVVPRL